MPTSGRTPDHGSASVHPVDPDVADAAFGPDDPIDTVETQVALLLRLADGSRRRTPQPAGALDRAGYLVLRHLTRNGPSGIGEIAEALGLDGSTVTRQVLALQAAGHVDRTGDPADARRVVVSPTPSGLDALDVTRRHRRTTYRRILATWSHDDRTELARLLTRLNESIDADTRG